MYNLIELSNTVSGTSVAKDVTDQETEAIEDINSTINDRQNNHLKNGLEERINIDKCPQSSNMRENNFIDPIYSEIEDGSIFLSQSIELDNHNDIQHFAVAGNPNVFYTKVNKVYKSDRDELEFKRQKSQIPLANIVKDSQKNKKFATNLIPLPTLPEPAESESSSYCLPLSSNLLLPLCKSLSDLRVMEHDSSPKKQPNLSKSDFTLHRSEIFFENLCKSELLVNVDFKRNSLEKLQNDEKPIPCLEKSLTSTVSMGRLSTKEDFNVWHDTHKDVRRNDSVSYELANDEVDIGNHETTESNLASNKIVPPSLNNQSTPKKRSFVTKDKAKELQLDTEKISDALYNSFPNSIYKSNMVYISDQQKESHCRSMDTVPHYESEKKSKLKSLNTLERYNSLKNLLNSSFRKSRVLIRKQGKRLYNSLNTTLIYETESSEKHPYTDLILNLDKFPQNESTSIREQLTKAVIICRELPQFETSMEMVEAERLLLFSTLREKNQLNFSSTVNKNHILTQKPVVRFFIDDMFLPVMSDIDQDKFFNNFYIVTFECGGVIKSTQSSECVNGMVVFRDNGIEFLSNSEFESNTLNKMSQNAVKCNIFMLRLRKIYSNSIEENQNAITETLAHPSATIKSTSSSNSSLSFDKIVSRFRLHASFTLDACDFVPYEYVHQESYNSNRICIRSSCFCNLPLAPRTKSANFSEQLVLKGRAEIRIRKRVFESFLNVQEPNKQHNWNKRWCTLDGIFLQVWEDKNSLSTSPLITIDLRDAKNYINYPLTCLSRELCPRPRSFSLIYKSDKPCRVTSSSAIYFAADTQENVDKWLKNINQVLNFIATWL